MATDIPEPPHPSERGRAGRTRTLTRIGFEFLIIFAGVWGALWAENRREEARDREKAVRIAEAMVTNLDTVAINWETPFIAEQQARLASWRESYERGDRPIPYFFRIPGGEQGPTEIWEAAIASGLLEVLDPVLVSDLGNFYREWGGMLIRLSRYQERTEELIFPGLGEGVEWYYKPGSTRLKPEFEGLVFQAEEVLGELADRNGWALPIRERLMVVIEELRR